MGQKYRGRIGQVQMTLHSWWVRKNANRISKIDDFVFHVFREHNQEADLWANSGAERQRRIVMDRCINSETWKAVNGYWDCSFKDDGKSGCGVVIKGVDRERWVTISRSAVPLKVGTAVAEVAGVCVLTGILDLVLNNFCVQSVNQCIKTFSTRNEIKFVE